MQLVIHAPFGARINRAWGLALRKKFCRTFDFELQAAADRRRDPAVARPAAQLPARRDLRLRHARHRRGDAGAGGAAVADVGDALALERDALAGGAALHRRQAHAAAASAHARGRSDGGGVPRGGRLPGQPRRRDARGHRAARSSAGAPRRCATACRRRWTPTGCARVLERIAAGEIAVPGARHGGAVAVGARHPERHALHVPRRRAARGAPLARGQDRTHARAATSASSTATPSARCVAEAEPDPRDADELHDLLCTAVALQPRGAWRAWYDELVGGGARLDDPAAAGSRPSGARSPKRAYGDDDVATTRARRRLHADRGSADGGADRRRAVAADRARRHRAGAPRSRRPRAAGQLQPAPRPRVVRARPLAAHPPADHRRLRERVRPVAPSEFVRFLLRWQHVMPGTRLHGVEGVAKVVEQLEGLELPAAAWERDILPARVHDYAPAMLDELCLSGEVAWARLRVTPPEAELNPRARAGAIGLFARTHAGWLIDPYARTDEPPSTWAHLSPLAREVAGDARAARRRLRRPIWRPALAARGARDRGRAVGAGAHRRRHQRRLRRPARAARRRARERPRRGVAGRWSLLHRDAPRRAEDAGPFGDGSPVELRLGLPAPLGRRHAPAAACANRRRRRGATSSPSIAGSRRAAKFAAAASSAA